MEKRFSNKYCKKKVSWSQGLHFKVDAEHSVMPTALSVEIPMLRRFQNDKF